MSQPSPSALYLHVVDSGEGVTVTASGNAFVLLHLARPFSLGGAFGRDACPLAPVARPICGSLAITPRASSAKRRWPRPCSAVSPGRRRQFGNVMHLPFTVCLLAGSAVEPSPKR